MKTFRLIILLAAISLAVAAMLAPALQRAKIGGGPKHPTCLFYLHCIQQAKTIYATEAHLTNDIAISKDQILPYLRLGGKWPQCPAGGEYSIGTLRESPRCSFSNHVDLRVTQ